MSKHLGGCHCGAVRFEVELDLENASECNCSICTKKGAVHHRATAFRLLSGEEYLTLYQFGEKKAKHLFCSRCGIHSFTNPRAAPDKVTVNLRCLDDYHEIAERLTIRQFDGRNWESAVTEFKFE